MKKIIDIYLARKRMLLAGLLLAAAGAILVACGNSSAGGAPANQIQPVRLSVKVEGDTVTVPLIPVQSQRNTQFDAPTSAGDQPFMAYVLDDGKVWVRSSLCPPCKGTSFSLGGNTLFCGNCGTIFNATTGKGVGGDCAKYPKPTVAYQLTNDSIVLSKADLTAAYEKVVK